MSDGGKGDRPRPIQVGYEQFARNFERIFGKQPMVKACPACQGEREVRCDDGKRTFTMPCPTCHGKGFMPRVEGL